MHLFSERWALVTSDPWVLDTMTNGLKIDFISHPIQCMPPRDEVISEEMQAVCNAEVASLLAKNAIFEVENDSIGFVCSFFCIPKKAGRFRLIVNLKPVNHFIRYEQIESLETVRFLVREGDWFVKLDPSLIKNPTKRICVSLGWGVFFSFVVWTLVSPRPPEYLQNFSTISFTKFRLSG